MVLDAAFSARWLSAPRTTDSTSDALLSLEGDDLDFAHGDSPAIFFAILQARVEHVLVALILEAIGE